MVIAKSSATGRDGGIYAGQVRRHDVGVPLDDDGLARLADVGPGQVQSVQDTAA
jgi:hypothetical protein